MPMERVKQKLSDVVHHWTAIAIITLFLFSVQPGPTISQALTVKPVEPAKTEKQLKREIVNKFSNDTYKHSEMLTDNELKDLLWSVGFEGNALKTAWAIAKRESNGRPMAYNGNSKTGDSSYGIFQINMIGNLANIRQEKFDLKSNKELFDPVTNAEITYYMSKGGTDWTAWKGLTPRAKEWLLRFPKA
jgi:hypothetical protein